MPGIVEHVGDLRENARLQCHCWFAALFDTGASSGTITLTPHTADKIERFLKHTLTLMASRNLLPIGNALKVIRLARVCQYPIFSRRPLLSLSNRLWPLFAAVSPTDAKISGRPSNDPVSSVGIKAIGMEIKTMIFL